MNRTKATETIHTNILVLLGGTLAKRKEKAISYLLSSFSKIQVLYILTLLLV